MQRTTLPYTRDLVLVGGGHTHALILRSWAMDPLPGARLSLVSPDPVAAYSGMLPGYVAGHYRREALDIDLVRLARIAGCRLVLGHATGIDTAARTIQVQGRPDIAFDIASIDIGITSDMSDLQGFSVHAVAAKPLGPFADAWAAFRSGEGPVRLAVIGGGVAGAELAMAMAYAMHSDRRRAEVRLIERDRAFAALGRRTGRKLRDALADLGVELLEGVAPVRVYEGGIELADGRDLPADFVAGAAGASPHTWLATTGLADARGFLPVDAWLRTADPAVFAVGDCAAMRGTPRPKAGVYAVRQAPVLFGNLRAALCETGGLKPYVPQRDYLKLISLGRKSALADRSGLSLEGPAFWRWKDRIDRRFMARFARLEPPKPPSAPWPRAAGATPAEMQKAMCGGCGAKVGPATLRKALTQGNGAGALDDAAILDLNGVRQVISTDHLRALVDDPVTMARIAAVHALGDIWAMGATPQAAVASIIVARQSPQLAERALTEIMQAARKVFCDAGASIVGGHSTQGAELVIGFTITGLCEADPITLSGARAGQPLILTKPIGSGIVMAAEMAGLAAADDVAHALNVMMQPQGAAAKLLAQASAMTDVTGFGLAGHLSNLCEASGVGAELWLDAVPVLPGARRLSDRGIRSSLFPENRQALPHLPDGSTCDVVFDPQTGGGLLAAIDGDPAPTVSALRSQGYEAAVIGQTTDRRGVIDIV